MNYCKHGHVLTEDNIIPARNGRFACRECARNNNRKYKASKRTPKVIKNTCQNGHDIAYRRPGRSDCSICHRETSLRRNRERGVKPAVRRTREEKLLQRRKWEADRKREQFVETVDPTVIWKISNGICGICGLPIVGKFEVDHIIPLARGGEHSYRNTQATHPRCNRVKWANTV